MIETLDDWYFTPEYQVMVWLPKVTSLLSIAGSICIIVNYFRDLSRRQKVFNNIVFFMSFFDIILSLTQFVGTWMLPRGFAYLAVGTTATCSMQGFLFVFAGGTSMLYGTVLSITFVLMINYRWKETDLQRWKSYLLYLPIAVNLVFAIVPLIGKLYNPLRTWGCYIATYPRGCSGDDCERGMERLYLPLYVMITAAQLLYFVGMIGCMVLLYRAVSRQEKRMKRYSVENWKRRPLSPEVVRRSSIKLNETCAPATGSRKTKPKRKVSIGQGGAAEEVAKQGLKYTCAWFITWVWWYAIVFIEFRIDAPPAPAWLYIIHSFFSPMQGLFNFLVYYKRSTDPLHSRFCGCIRRGSTPSGNTDAGKADNAGTVGTFAASTSLQCHDGSMVVSVGGEQTHDESFLASIAEATDADCRDSTDTRGAGGNEESR